MLDMAVLAFRALMTRLKMLNAYLLDSVVTLLRMVAHCPIGWLGLIALFFLPLVQGADDGLSNGTDDMVRDVVALGAMALLSSKITAEWVLQGLNDRQRDVVSRSAEKMEALEKAVAALEDNLIEHIQDFPSVTDAGAWGREGYLSRILPVWVLAAITRNLDQDNQEPAAKRHLEEIIVCNEAPPQDNLLRGDALRRGQPKPRVAVNFHPERVVMLIRTYDEVDSSGNILTGYSNRNCKYFHLPLQCYNPLDYYSSRAVLGHVRLKPIQKIKRKEVSRMYQETHACDRRDLERKYNAE